MNRLDSPLKRMVYAAMFGALTALGAFIVIPLQPVPVSLQTLFCGLAGVLLGGYTGALSQIVYILLGIIGLPVFAGGKAGLGTLFGPTGGYLLGFIAAAFVIGKIVESRPRAGIVLMVAALLAGNVIIYSCGTLQLSLIAHLSLSKSLMAGVIPFLPGDVLKLAAAAWIGSKMRPFFK